MGFLIFIFALDLQKERNKKPDFAEGKLKGNYSRKEVRGGSRTILRDAKI